MTGAKPKRSHSHTRGEGTAAPGSTYANTGRARVLPPQRLCTQVTCVRPSVDRLRQGPAIAGRRPLRPGSHIPRFNSRHSYTRPRPRSLAAAWGQKARRDEERVTARRPTRPFASLRGVAGSAEADEVAMSCSIGRAPSQTGKSAGECRKRDSTRRRAPERGSRPHFRQKSTAWLSACVTTSARIVRTLAWVTRSARRYRTRQEPRPQRCAVSATTVRETWRTRSSGGESSPGWESCTSRNEAPPSILPLASRTSAW
mmetsp:Transcript_6052/g.19344  ORF Transcript_6052/g.19344 Transcript_6052/m.19344 type:complete len:257 (-) Transcript_6052:591-1361(-)